MNRMVFNPDAYLRRSEPPVEPPPVAPAAMSFEWTRGIAQLAQMASPKGACPTRWRQIAADAKAFVDQWHETAELYEWSTAQVFGFDLDAPSGMFGLVLVIRGDQVVGIDDLRATITGPTGTRHHYRRTARPDSPPLWQLRSIDQ